MKEELQKAIEQVEKDLRENSKDCPPEISKLVNEHFWDLLT